MNPIELVKRDLSPEEWDVARQCDAPVRELAEQCPFSRHRLFLVYGRTRQFEFPTLPHGSLCYYAANGRSAVRLTRKYKEIETILADEWDALPASDPVCLAELILKFYDAGIKATHQVLQDADVLQTFSNSKWSATDYELNQKEFTKALPGIGLTESTCDGDCLRVRAITLCGWMHNKRNLGIETLSIAPNGKVSLAKRRVLSRRIFSRVPGIRY